MNFVRRIWNLTLTCNRGSARAVPRYPSEFWKFGYRWVPCTGKIWEKNFLVPISTRYQPEKISDTDGYRVQARKKIWVPMGTGYWPEKKILSTDAYRVPARKKFWVPVPIGVPISTIRPHQNDPNFWKSLWLPNNFMWLYVRTSFSWDKCFVSFKLFIKVLTLSFWQSRPSE